MSAAAGRIDVALVAMPLLEVQHPSIALGLLQAALAKDGLRSDVIYGNLAFAQAIGLVQYQALLMTPTDHLVGEWCFAQGLFPDFRPDDDEYLDLVLEVQSRGFPAELEQRKELVRWVRSQTEGFVERLARSIVDRRPRIVGCSSMFQQHCASLALLRQVRTLSPDTVTIMGGANCEGEMGLETLRAFPFVDCVVSGEADGLIGQLCRLLIEHGRQVGRGVLPHGASARADLEERGAGSAAGGSWPPRSAVYDLDSLPVPDYHSFFEAVEASPLSPQIDPGLLIESSRGCWWGERSHCTFCGLNGAGMSYRSKSADRVLAELAELSDRHDIRTFQFVDNILDMRHLDTLVPRLAEAGNGYSLFYETKANLKREHLRLLAEAGVVWIQPGIENLHDGVLRLIGKGNKASMNLQLLKWAAEFGLHVSWNVLCDFPGEQDDWYLEMAEWLPAIFHLEPPSGLIRVRYDRFSPYQMEPRRYGINLAPTRTYAYVYPLDEKSLARLACSFEDVDHPAPLHRGVMKRPGHRAVQEAVRRWCDAWCGSRPVLTVRDEGDRLEIRDTRAGVERPSRTLRGLEAEIYRLCDTAQTTASLPRKLAERSRGQARAADVDEAVESLCRNRDLLRLDGVLLSIGVSEGTGARPARAAPEFAAARTVA